MLESIVEKRKKSLGNVSQKTNAGEPAHYCQFYDFIITGEHLGSTSLSARRANGQGYYITRHGPELYVPSDPNDKTGPLLLTTALIYHRSLPGNRNYVPPYDAMDADINTILA